jgi:hypothetical protein
MIFTFDMSEIHKMAARYETGPQIVHEEVRKGMTDVTITIEAKAKQLVPTDTHALQRSIAREVVDQGTSVIGRVGTNKTVEGGESHGALMEFGRTPGKMPPPGALLPWMRRHGIDAGKAPGANAKSQYHKVEYVVARAINYRKKKRAWLLPAYNTNRLRISKEFGNAVPKRILARLAK